MLRYAPAVAVGRLVRWVARKRKPGGGAAIPGVVVNRLAPGFLPQVLNSFPQGLVVVTGTAGKSTTTRMLAAIVSAHGKRVFTNPSTANIAQGLTSAILAQSTITGRIEADIAILEMDEGHAAKLSERAPADVCVLLNVCVDQVDRFFDPQLVTGMLSKVARATTGPVIFNADDLSIVEAVQTVSTERSVGFGMGSALRSTQLRNMGYVRPALAVTPPEICGELSSVDGRRASLRLDGVDADVHLPAIGVHYGVDAVAALTAASRVLGQDYDPVLASRTLSALDPVFGRGETLTIRGQEIDMVLIQNPTSFRLNVNSIPAESDCVMIAVGSDVRDYAYLWPVHLDHLSRLAIAAGPKAREVAIHALYNDVAVDSVEENLELALEAFLALPRPSHGRKTLVFSADSMRRTRRYFDLAEQGVWES